MVNVCINDVYDEEYECVDDVEDDKCSKGVECVKDDECAKTDETSNVVTAPEIKKTMNKIINDVMDEGLEVGEVYFLCIGALCSLPIMFMSNDAYTWSLSVIIMMIIMNKMYLTVSISDTRFRFD